MATVDNPEDTSGRLIAASKVNGTTVYNRSGDRLGTVYDLMLDKRSGKAEYAVMSFGGFLGMGERYHPLPWHVLTYSQDHGGYVVDLDRTKIEGRAELCRFGAVGRRHLGHPGERLLRRLRPMTTLAA